MYRKVEMHGVRNMCIDVIRKLALGLISLSSIVLFQETCFAAKNGTKVNFDFVSRQVIFYGVFTPEGDGTRDGLSAELLARRDGIAHLTSKLQDSCNGLPAAPGAVRPSSNGGWISSVRSQGSEIYANGVLKISLMAPVREVFKEFPANSSPLKSKSGVPLSIRFPIVSIDKIKCGKLSLSVGARKVDVNPFLVSRDSTEKTVRVVYRGDSLVPATPEDSRLLEESNLFAAQPSLTSDAPQSAPTTTTTRSASE